MAQLQSLELLDCSGLWGNGSRSGASRVLARGTPARGASETTEKLREVELEGEPEANAPGF